MKKFGFILFIGLLAKAGNAQLGKFNSTAQLTAETDFSGHINNRFHWECDVQYSRQSNYNSMYAAAFPSQYVFRPWLRYSVDRAWTVSAFCGVWHNFQINGNVNQLPSDEYRTAVEGEYDTSRGRNSLSNIFRTEVRDLADNNGQREAALRERYMLRYQCLLNSEHYDEESCYAIVSEEACFDDGSEVTGGKLFDQNNLFVGIGYTISDDLTLETGFSNQIAGHSQDASYDVNNALQITLIFDNL